MLQIKPSDQEFNPTNAGLWANPCYLIRRIISLAIRENAFHLKGRILDYGCGSKPYETFFEASEYIGVDLETSGHPDGRKRADVFFDGTHLPFDTNEFDGVLASEVFEHVFNLDTCLAEINRVLKPGGRLLITCPFVWPLHEEPYDFARYTPYALTQILENSGFRVLAIDQKGTPVEVLAQLFVAEVLPKVFCPLYKKPFRRLHNFLNAIAIGIIFGISRLLAKLFNPNQRLYLTNLVVAEKNTPIEKTRA